MSLLKKNQGLDGYRLIRLIGQGGFGEVWLCQSEAMGDYRALKFIPAGNADLLEKEHHALGEYRKAAARLRSPNLMPIEHVNRHESGLFCVMPLADGTAGLQPSDENWRPLTLGSLLREKATESSWLSSEEVVLLIVPILDALQTLSTAGLVHRDVKPENILFFDGQPCLSDISLLEADSMGITRRGTPGYTAPSWYTGGHVDMYGAAATIYTLLTGNPPDRMGRSAFAWPPQGEALMSAADRAEWNRLHAVIRRAVDEHPTERFVDFLGMALAIQGQRAEIQEDSHTRRKPTWIPIFAVAATVAILIFWVNRTKERHGENPAFPGSEVAEVVTSATSKDHGEDERIQKLVIGALSNYQNVPSFLNLPLKERNVFFDIWLGLDVSLYEGNYPIAMKQFDLLSEKYPEIGSLPSARLAALLLEKCLGNTSALDQAIGDPALTAIRADDIAPEWRVSLFRALGCPGKGEEYLTNLLQTASPKAAPEYHRLRGEMRAQQGNFSGCVEDRNSAFGIMPGDFPGRTLEEIEWEKLEQKFPAFGDLQRGLPRK